MPIVPLSRSPSYLHECLALHNEVTRLRFGRAQDLSVVERAAARIRSSRRLIYDDVYAIAAAPEFGVGMVYWQWPTRTEVKSALADQSLDLWNLPKNEKKTVGLLRTAFKSIEAASVLLRFIVPEHYSSVPRRLPCPKIGTRPVRRRADSTRSWQHCPSRSRPTRAVRTGCARSWRCLCATPPQHLADRWFPLSPSRWRYRDHRPASPRGGACCTEAAGPC